MKETSQENNWLKEKLGEETRSSDENNDTSGSDNMDVE